MFISNYCCKPSLSGCLEWVYATRCVNHTLYVISLDRDVEFIEVEMYWVANDCIYYILINELWTFKYKEDFFSYKECSFYSSQWGDNGNWKRCKGWLNPLAYLRFLKEGATQ